MNMGHHVLPTARRIDGEANRYVRSEYGEKESHWFTLSALTGARLRLPGGETPTRGVRAVGTAASESGQTARCCPVMSALSESRLMNGAARGEPSGKQ